MKYGKNEHTSMGTNSWSPFSDCTTRFFILLFLLFLAAFVNSKNRFCEALNDAFLRSWASFSRTTNELF